MLKTNTKSAATKRIYYVYFQNISNISIIFKTIKIEISSRKNQNTHKGDNINTNNEGNEKTHKRDKTKTPQRGQQKQNERHKIVSNKKKRKWWGYHQRRKMAVSQQHSHKRGQRKREERKEGFGLARIHTLLVFVFW